MAEMWKDKEWLEEKYLKENLGSPSIALLTGCTKGIVLYWLRKFSIPIRSHQEAAKRVWERGEFRTPPQSSQFYRDKEWLYFHYVTQRLTTWDVADKAGCSQQTIRRWLRKLDVPIRDMAGLTKEEAADRLYRNEEWLRRNYCDLGKSLHELAQQFKCDRGTIKWWLDRYGIKRRDSAQSVELARQQGKFKGGDPKKTAERHAQGLYNHVYSSEIRKKRAGEALRKAWAEGRIQAKIGSENPAWRGGPVKRECEICNSEFEVPQSIIDRGQGLYCSQPCQWKAQSNHKQGENGSNWQGGKSFEPYPPAFNETFKRTIRERDGHRCAICRMFGSSVHHINYQKQDTSPENTITLCTPCHGVTGSNREYWEEALSKLIKARLEYGGSPFDVTARI